MERSAARLTHVALWLSVGVFGLLWAPLLPPWWSLLLALPVACVLPTVARLPALALLLGIAWAWLHAHAVLSAQWPVSRHGEDVQLRGTITQTPERGHGNWRFLLTPDDGDAVAAPLRVSWYRSDIALQSGDCLALELRMRAPRGSVSPGAFDYERWMFSQRLAGTAYVRSGGHCEHEPVTSRPIWRLARSGLDERLRTWLGTHPGGGLVRALVVAKRDAIDDSDWDVLRRTGTSHLLAISGLHIGLVAGTLLLAGRALWRRSAWLSTLLAAPRAGVLLGSLGALGYAALAGFTVPTQRALLMWLVLALALWSARQSRPLHVLALAWLAVVAADPLTVLSAGTWLSFIAVFTLIYVSAGRADGTPGLRDVPRMQLALLVALAPATLLFFHGASLLAPLVNALLIPLFGVLLPALLLTVLLALATDSVVPLLWMADALYWLRLALGWVADVGEGLWWEAAPSLAALVATGIAAVLLLLPRGVPSRPLALVLLLPLLWPRPGVAPDQAAISVLDVGQGLAVVVRTARHSLVYDAGPAWPGGFDAGEGIVAPYLRTHGLRSIDRLLLSHAHMDHMGGIAALKAAFPVGAAHGLPGGAACDTRLRWQWDGVAFEVLHPAPGAQWGINNVSCVLRIEAGGTVALLTGDIEARGERDMLRRVERDHLRAAALTAPHHGSRTSSTIGLVHATSPDLVVHGAGWRNRYGHPHADVRRRWEEIGAQQILTGSSGTVQFRIGAEGVTDLRAARPQSRRLWRAPPHD